MNATEIVITKRLIYRIAIGIAILAALFIAGGGFWRQSASGDSSIGAGTLVAGSEEKFAMLSSRGTQESVGST